MDNFFGQQTARDDPTGQGNITLANKMLCYVAAARKLLSTVTNASIEYIAGFVAKAVEERRTCTACPYLHEAHSSSPELVGLISLST
ncbi:hypothetical protein HPB50_029636 [Hyalomma asiaticum]|nr:hypothetical protein HPB50_029636 [Hyalomma asiaticum]